MAIGEDFEAVLDAAVAGDGPAASRLHADLVGVVSGYLRGHGAREPEDVASATFLDVFRNLHRFEGDEAAFRSWVFTIAHRRLVDDRRHRRRRAWLVPLDDHDPPTSDPDATQEVSPELRVALDALTPLQREVVLLRIVVGLTVEEVADVVGRRRGAVRSAHHRALAQLRRSVDGVQGAHDPRSRVTGRADPTITGS